MLAWRLPISLYTAFCTKAIEEAIAKFRKPEIFNTDQGSQVHQRHIHRLPLEHGTRISMDGKSE